MDIEEKIKSDYKKLKSLSVAQDIKLTVLNKGNMINLYDVVDFIKRIADENELDNNLKCCVTKKVYSEVITLILNDYIKNTKSELGIK